MNQFLTILYNHLLLINIFVQIIIFELLYLNKLNPYLYQLFFVIFKSIKLLLNTFFYRYIMQLNIHLLIILDLIYMTVIIIKQL